MSIKKRKLENDKIAQMIRIITSSPINTTSKILRDVDLGDTIINVYQDNVFYIKCITRPGITRSSNEKAYKEYKYEMYFNNELVFHNVPSMYSSFTTDKYDAVYNTYNLKAWCDLFLKIYSVCSKAYNLQKETEEREKREREDYYNYVNDIAKRTRQISVIFCLLKDNRLGRFGFYEDDKIIIDNITFENFTEPDYSNSMDYTEYYGRIKLKDGTILMDSYQGIFHPGNWEDYVLNLITELRTTLSIMNERLRQKQQKQKILERQRYELNHSPIDDSKYF